MCLSESQLIRLLADELEPHERQAAMQHLESCDDCRRRHAEMRSMWDLLGEWQVIPPATSTPIPQLLHLARRRDNKRRLRLAASVLIAIGAGVAAGVLVPQRPVSQAMAPATEQDVVDSLGLDLLGADLPLASLFDVNWEAEFPEEAI